MRPEYTASRLIPYPVVLDSCVIFPLMVGEKDHFFCEYRPDTQRGGEVWTVMYRHDKGIQPWLKVVTTLGGGYTPEVRCEKIAERLELYRKNGLTKLSYRGDPKTPNQYVICAKTKLSGDNCPLLVTLKPGGDTEAYKAWQDITENFHKGSGSDKKSKANSTSSGYVSAPSPEIDLNNFYNSDVLFSR